MAFCNLHLLFLDPSFIGNHLLIYCHYKLLFTFRWLSGKESPANEGDVGSIPGLGRFLQKEMATHHSILAWKIPSTEEPSGLLSTGLQKSCTCLVNKQQHICVHTYDTYNFI